MDFKKLANNYKNNVSDPIRQIDVFVIMMQTLLVKLQPNNFI